LISSVCSRGCICCISSCPGPSRIVVVAGKDVIRLTWPIPVSGNSRVRRVRHSLSSHRASCTRRRRRRCRQTQSRPNSPPSRSTMPSIHLSRSAHLSIFLPPIVISQRENRPQVYECMVRGIAVMRRRADSYVNATQILKVAGVEKGRRTKILEKEILPGKHEIVQGGYGKYQGTWYVSPFVKLNIFLTSAQDSPRAGSRTRSALRCGPSAIALV